MCLNEVRVKAARCAKLGERKVLDQRLSHRVKGVILRQPERLANLVLALGRHSRNLVGEGLDAVRNLLAAFADDGDEFGRNVLLVSAKGVNLRVQVAHGSLDELVPEQGVNGLQVFLTARNRDCQLVRHRIDEERAKQCRGGRGVAWNSRHVGRPLVGGRHSVPSDTPEVVAFSRYRSRG